MTVNSNYSFYLCGLLLNPTHHEDEGEQKNRERKEEVQTDVECASLMGIINYIASIGHTSKHEMNAHNFRLEHQIFMRQGL
jgi:hypothetical protein